MQRTSSAVDVLDVRRARIIVPGALKMATRRCMRRELRLRPDRDTTHAWLYALGYSQGKYDLKLHEFSAPSNHHHLGYTDQEDSPAFFREFHSLLARSVNARWGDQGELWDGESYNDLRLLDGDEALEYLAYMLTNTVKHGLVQDAREWPGATSYHLEYGDALIIDRPDFFFTKDMPKQVEVRLSRPPIEPDKNDRELRRFVREVARTKQGELIRKLQEEGGSFMGAEAVLRQPRHSSPLTRAPRRGIEPTVASSSKWTRICVLRHQQGWHQHYRECRKRHEAGERDVQFPFGTYLLRVRYGVSVEPRPAWAAAPFPEAPEPPGRKPRPP